MHACMMSLGTSREDHRFVCDFAEVVVELSTSVGVHALAKVLKRADPVRISWCTRRGHLTFHSFQPVVDRMAPGCGSPS